MNQTNFSTIINIKKNNTLFSNYSGYCELCPKNCLECINNTINNNEICEKFINNFIYYLEDINSTSKTCISKE